MPVAAGDLVPLGYLNSALSGVQPLGGPIVSAQVVDFASGVLSVMLANGFNSGTEPGVYPGGGLIVEAGLLAVDSGVISYVGHTHRAVDIVDLAAAFMPMLAANIVAGSGIAVSLNSGTGPLTISAQLAPGSALLLSAAGLAVNLGTSHTQAAYGDHTHALLHNPITLGASSSLSGTLNGQQLSYEVRVVPGGGILVTPSGVQVDPSVVQLTGSGSSGTPLTVMNTSTVHLSYLGNVLSGVVPLDLNPPTGGGLITAGVNGLYVSLGSGTQQAAPGNHTHTAATESSDGFLSAADKTRIDEMWANPTGITPVSTTTIILGMTGSQLSGTLQFHTNPIAGNGALGSDAGGLFVVLGNTANTAAPGNVISATLGLQSGVALFTNLASGGSVTVAQFNALAATVNQVISLLQALGLPA